VGEALRVAGTIPPMTDAVADTRTSSTDRPGTTLRVALCQLDLVVGDLDGNAAMMRDAYARADAAGADLVVFPELAICGYPPEDLLLKPGFVEQSQDVLHLLAAACDGHAVAAVGWVDGRRHPGADPHDATDGPWNAAAVLHGGRVVGSYHKQALPNYGVFDEKRYFDPGPAGQDLYRVAGVTVAVTVCEDAWVAQGAVAEAAAHGAQVVVNLNASPFHRGKQRARREMLSARVGESGLPIVYLNLVGGQDDLVFDGGSVVIGADGAVVAQCPRFERTELVVDVAVPERAPVAGRAVVDLGAAAPSRPAGPPRRVDTEAVVPGSLPVAGQVADDGPEEVWRALMLGLRDYVTKNGFGDVVIGLSGGVDSSIVAALAADALGPERVHGVLMPSRYSSDHSLTDAAALADRLGIDHRVIAIEAAHVALLDLLAPSFGDLPADLTEENLQSRIRGVLLMALSNKLGWLVLSTGNKSETAVGYSTLYGDTAGGLAVIKDVPKLLVYELCRWRNDVAGRELIPDSVLTKAPSAELRPDQTDDQSLPPYEVLDPLIQAYVDQDRTVGELIAAGHDRATVERITSLIDRAEYKRRQSPPGIRISEKAFGRDRRLPITNRY
jgi:NAD+ synthase (glutamine-hydrolysing)